MLLLCWTRSRRPMSFLYLETQNSMGRYGLISVEELKDHVVQPACCIPAHAAQEAIGPFCHKSTLLTHTLLVFYLDSQVFFCKAAFWICGPKVSLLHRIAHSQVQDFTPVLIEFHEVPTGPCLQLVKIHLLARRKQICHGHLKQLTGERQLDLMEEWRAENLKHKKKKLCPSSSKTTSSSIVLQKGFYNIIIDNRQNMKLIKAFHVSN